MKGLIGRGLAAAALALSFLAPLPAFAKNPYKDYVKVDLESGPTLLDDLKMALLTAQPGTVIQLPKVVLDVDEELSIAVSHVVLRGKNPKKTVLRFAGQTSGAQGILITGDHVVIENLAVEDTPGDGIRAEGVKGITFRKVRVEWTGPLAPENGAYGLYPVLAEDVLVEKCEVIGASDAGVYVGQSTGAIVRRNKVHGNVAGIEIENTFDADVYKNKTWGNTGGILVFNHPDLTQQGARTRVFQNKIDENNAPNVGSGSVGQVPPGTGVIVLANDQVEIFKNKIRNHWTVGIVVVNYDILASTTPPFDEHPEALWIYNNKYKDNGTDPQFLLGVLVASYFGNQGLDITLESAVDPDKQVGGELPPELRNCVEEKKVRFGALNISEAAADPASGMPSTDVTPYVCSHTPLPEVMLPETPPPPSPALVAACSGGRDTAYLADCPRLSDYGLFVGNDPLVPVADGLPWDLTTPLFSDYALKYRIAYLPPGTQALYDEDLPFDFPVGTILAKTFTFALDLRDPGLGEEVIETRLLIHRPGGWVGRPYIWRSNDADADLALIGGSLDVSWIHTDGSERSTHYSIPNANQCVRCHTDGGPIGPKAALLNRDYDYGSGPENQLSHWFAVGALDQDPDPLLAPRIPVFDDPADGTLEERAKGYLDINCSHCHSDAGSARNTGLYLEWSQPVDVVYGVCKTTIAAGSAATGGFTYDILPGVPEESILPYRMAATDPQAAMPELARSVVHDEGLAVVQDWIATLPGSCP